MSDQQKPSSKRHEEGQGPASLHQSGPAAGYGLKELGQPTESQNAEAAMEQKIDRHATKRFPQ